MEFVQIKGGLELGYLSQLLSRHQQLSTERWMLEVQFPQLKGQSPELIRDAYVMTRQTGAIKSSAKESGPPDVLGGGDLATRPAATSVVDGVTDVAVLLEEGKGLVDVRLRLTSLEKERERMGAIAQPDNPKIRTLDEEIAGIKGGLQNRAEIELARMKDRAAAIDMQMSALEEAQRRWKNSYLLASRKNSDFQHLQMAVSRLESMYASLYTRLNDLKIDREIKAETFTIPQPVQTQPKPVWPDPWKILLASLAVGLGSGLGLALLAFFIDDKVQSVNDVEAEVGVPFLGGIPYWVHSDLVNRIRPIVSEQHKSGAAEAYRALRTNVLAAVEKAGKKVLLITSADSKEGKTLTTLNLAIMIAHTNKRVLLVDMDLRRGVLHKSMEIERSPGVCDALRDGQPLMSVVVPTPHMNVWFAPAGSIVKTTSELLSAVDLTEFLREAAEKFDFVIMDSAPVLRVTDTVILANCPLCSVIYIAHANHTSKPVIKYSLDMLGDVHVIGLIVNSIEMHRISSLYYTYQYPNYAYYSYAYAYGYDYDLYDENRRRGRPMSRLGAARRRTARWFNKTFLPPE
jgi:capsular exopolysaccharide synthesis family protein